ncbi:hypothetical protein [Methanothrix soehngenii]|uniref:hypothetical protein n=1 Tax=Methanothrix soehngenii TaxID=2223 RepID=UPI00300D92A7
MAADKNPGYQEIIKQIQKEPLSEGIRLEIELEDALAANFDILKKFGHDLELYVDPESKQSGRQFICKGNGGRIDLLCCDRTQDRYVVIRIEKCRKLVKIHSDKFPIIWDGFKIGLQETFQLLEL